MNKPVLFQLLGFQFYMYEYGVELGTFGLATSKVAEMAQDKADKWGPKLVFGKMGR